MKHFVSIQQHLIAINCRWIYWKYVDEKLPNSQHIFHILINPFLAISLLYLKMFLVLLKFTLNLPIHPAVTTSYHRIAWPEFFITSRVNRLSENLLYRWITLQSLSHFRCSDFLSSIWIGKLAFKLALHLLVVAQFFA